MRAIVIAGLMAMCISLIAASGSTAAPSSGAALLRAASHLSPVVTVRGFVAGNRGGSRAQGRASSRTFRGPRARSTAQYRPHSPTFRGSHGRSTAQGRPRSPTFRGPRGGTYARPQPSSPEYHRPVTVTGGKTCYKEGVLSICAPTNLRGAPPPIACTWWGGGSGGVPQSFMGCNMNSATPNALLLSTGQCICVAQCPPNTQGVGSSLGTCWQYDPCEEEGGSNC
jgi:hypothetical protein